MGFEAPGDVRAAPARRVLVSAELASRGAGHENSGFLSEAAGFMPLAAPKLSSPAEFAAWDEVAAELPHLHGTLRLRPRLDALPHLGRQLPFLPESSLLRAGHLLAMLAHAYQYVETTPPEALPQALVEPWAEVRRRLDRPDAVLSYIDLIVYNFRLEDTHAPNPFQVENMRLLTPTVDTDEERIFYLTQTEILAQTSALVGAVARAQEAVLDDDPGRLARELLLVIERISYVVRTSLLKIDPNPHGRTFVNPVVWAKTVAPFAVPIQKGIQGPSGTSSPLFSLMDAFFGRQRHDSFLGREIRDLRRGYPRVWRDFIAAAGEISIKDYIDRTKQTELQELWNEALAGYAGSDGFLGRHRMKVYGYLELAFKVGRSVTIGGFAGLFKDRTWDRVDAELESSRRERLERFPATCRFADVQPTLPPDASCTELSRRVVLGVGGSAVSYVPGDRCGVLAENDEELVTRTLAALAASGTEPVELTSEWIDHLRLRPGFEGQSQLCIRDLLRFGRIRPVIPRVAEALHAVTQHPALLGAIVNQTTTRHELWELLLELADSGFDVRRLWQAPVSFSGYLSRVVPPENFRMYSISSAMTPGARYAEQLELTVGLVRYHSRESIRAPERVRAGTASHFLGAAPEGRRRVPFVIQHPLRFGLPEDQRTPIVLVAGGTGVAPFLSFIRSRLDSPGSGRCLLYWGIRTRADFLDRKLLASAVAAGKLELHVAFSREPVTVRFLAQADGGGDFEFVEAKSTHVDALLLRDDHGPELLRLLASPLEAGLGAHFYVCGRSRFARSVDCALRSLVALGYHTKNERAIDHILAGWAGEGRYQREIYTDPRPDSADEPQLDVSEIVTRNDEHAGHWFVIDGRVYDLTSFLGMHPGGLSVLRGYAGTDATQGYLRAHARATEVDAMRETYAIGKLRVLDFRGQSRVVERGQATQRMSLATLHRAWVAFVYLVVEMQNALRTDLGLKAMITARGEPVAPRSPYKIER
jgi:sulfite reductase alpha subunit-like flavoprotein